jgi:putative tricarboxylic transport membrane protein
MIIDLVGQKSIIHKDVEKQSKFADILTGLIYPLKDKLNVVISAVIGVVVGLLPAAGSSIAATLSYGFAQTHSKNRKNFGKGEPSGVVCAESANSSCEGGSMATMMAFGIPGSGVTAMIMAAFMIAGYVPGPYLMRENMDVAYAVVWGNLISAVLIVAVGLIFIRYFCKVIYIPTQILATVITVLAVIGAFGVRYLYLDVIVLCVFALFAYVMRKGDYPVLPLVLGFILGGLVDAQFARTLALYSGRYEILLERPLFVALLIFNILVFSSPLIAWMYKKVKKNKTVSA